MKKLLVFILFLIAALIIKAQTPVSKEDSSIATIKQLTLQWYKAIKSRDSFTLDRILAPDFTVNGSWSREKWFDNILHHFKMDSFEVAAEPKFSNYDDALLSEGLLYWKGTNDDKPFMNAEFNVTDIWVFRNNRWQVLMRMLKFYKKR